MARTMRTSGTPAGPSEGVASPKPSGAAGLAPSRSDPGAPVRLAAGQHDRRRSDSESAASGDLGQAAAYDGVQKSFHWLIVALVATQFVIAWTMPDIPRGQPATGLVDLHLSIGVTILIVMVLRLAWRLAHSVPRPPRDIPPWQQAAAKLTHYALYVLLLIMPFAGWAWASAKGWDVTLYGLVKLPALIANGSELGPLAAQTHATVAIVILVVAGFHALAALRHYFLLKDRVLQRMLPETGARR